ncbi:rhodanese-like domain-containing protein [Flavobacterium jejuense]|uniref:Rhodanese-like domain-containing protein n=1 Tax=Flavobacterium jejuense TaxID=1544455 RepID=A0ABX0IVN1_9FLAO|nr:rhodanese-like domain-containing protein [Flavobacterium jejuense]NHN27241.1 rhodanese-like domain-containing protein [Flavobacterium jejuense]
MKKGIVFLFLILLNVTFSQKTISDVIQRYNKNSVSYITAEELHKLNDFLLLDTREAEEYQVSHLEKAVFVGYKKFDAENFQSQYPNKDIEIVVYCSLGVRSENIGEKLLKLGYKNVQNLYGGLFEWKNKGYSIVDNKGKVTEKVHAFSKMWGKYLQKGIKVYKNNKK